MIYHDELKKRLEHELGEICRKPEMRLTDLHLIHELTDTIKNLDKIAILREDDDDPVENRRPERGTKHAYGPRPVVRRRPIDEDPDWDVGFSRAEAPPMREDDRGEGKKMVQAGGTFWMRDPAGQGASDGEMRPLDEASAMAWVRSMRNSDGTSGEHFNRAQAEQYRQAVCPQCGMWAFYAAINAMYSDYSDVAKRMGMDKPDFYAQMAKAFLEDEDAGKHKIEKYMRYIAGN